MAISGQTASINSIGLPRAGALPSRPGNGRDERFVRRLIVALLGPFVLIGYLISHIWK